MAESSALAECCSFAALLSSVELSAERERWLRPPVPLELMLLVSRYTSFSLQRQTKTPPSGRRYRRRPTLMDTSRRRIERTKLAPLSPTKDMLFRRSNAAGL